VRASERRKRWPPRKKQSRSTAGKKQSRSTAAKNIAIERPRKIGETAKLIGVEPHVLRFWETQFPFIRPKQSRSRHRYYSQVDIETLKVVKRLLHTEGYTIAGARKFVRDKGLDHVRALFSPPGPPVSGRRTKEQLDGVSAIYSPNALVRMTSNGVHRALREIREELRELHKLLETR
jgi:DNA-binding transcriptional MerR regulator